MFSSEEVGHDRPTSFSKNFTVMKYTNIRYSVMLNDEQYAYLSDECQEINRLMCFHTFLKMAVMEETKVSKKNFSAVLQPGQFMASKVELSVIWRCNRKTATRIVKEFNQMGFIHSVPSNRTTIHTLKCLSVWFTNQRAVKNTFFTFNPTVRPIGKSTKGESNVTPENGQEPTENDHTVSSVPAATSDVKIGAGDEGFHPSEASNEGTEERKTEPPFPSRPEDDPKGEIVNPPSGDMSDDSHNDIQIPLNGSRSDEHDQREGKNGDVCRDGLEGNN